MLRVRGGRVLGVLLVKVCRLLAARNEKCEEKAAVKNTLQNQLFGDIFLGTPSDNIYLM
jgi:hypothetical protein